MLPKPDYLKILEHEPEETFFYDERPVLYKTSHDGDDYLVGLVEQDIETRTDRFLLVQYSDEIFNLLKNNSIGVREFFFHPGNNVHNVLVDYVDDSGPILTFGEPYDDNTAIPHGYLPDENEPLSYYED